MQTEVLGGGGGADKDTIPHNIFWIRIIIIINFIAPSGTSLLLQMEHEIFKQSFN